MKKVKKSPFTDLVKVLKEDRTYYKTIAILIAQEFQMESRRYKYKAIEHDVAIDQISKQAAKNFLDFLIENV